MTENALIVKMSLRAFLWNVRGWRTKDAEIIRRSQDCEVFFITETKSKRKTTV